MAAMFGLLAALLWGLTDFLVSLAGRGYGIHRSMLYAQLVGVVGIGIWLIATWSNLTVTASPQGWIAAVVSAPIGMGATLALYRGLKSGKVSVVTPITATFGAVTALLSMATGEHVSDGALAGIAMVAIGAFLVGARTGSPAATPEASGAPWGLAAAIGYGVQFWIQGRYAVPQLGSIVPVWIYYAISATLLLVAAPLRQQSIVIPISGLKIAIMTGSVGVGGFLALSLGFATGHIAIVATLASLQSAITVCLACIYHRERLGLLPALGIPIIIAGLVALHFK